MSAAATAAGYLYASGRLRGKHGDDQRPRNRHEEDRLRKLALGQRQNSRASQEEACGEGGQSTPTKATLPPADKPIPKVTYKARKLK